MSNDKPFDPGEYVGNFLRRTLSELGDPDEHAIAAVEDATRMMALAFEMRAAAQRANDAIRVGDEDGARMELDTARRLMREVEQLHAQAKALTERARTEKGSADA